MEYFAKLMEYFSKVVEYFAEVVKSDENEKREPSQAPFSFSYRAML